MTDEGFTGRIYFPRPQSDRDKTIAALHKQGVSTSELVSRYRISRSRVHQIIARSRLIEEGRARILAPYGWRLETDDELRARLAVNLEDEHGPQLSEGSQPLIPKLA